MAKLHAETGRTFDQWVELARRRRLKKASELQASLRDGDSLGSRVAWWITQAALSAGEPDYEDPEALVEALYSGPRASMRALHEQLVDEFLALGDDVLVTACKTIVPVYRKFVFGELKPVGRGIQISLALSDVELSHRLREAPARSGEDRLTRVVVVGHEDEIDEQLRAWFERAYANGAKKSERPTEFAVPPEFRTALKRSKPAAETWAACTPAMQRDMISWITSAKQQATRDKRLGIAIQKLAVGKRRVY